MGSPDASLSLIQQVRRALLVSYASGQYLDAVGNNRGVPRPTNTNDEEIYRRLIKALAWLPKGLPLSYYALVSAVFGTQAQARAQVGRAWKIYEVNANEVIIEIPAALVAGSLETSSYLHGTIGYARVTSGPSGSFTTDVDLRTAIATSVVGATVVVETSLGTWTNYTVTGYSFSAGVATVGVTPSTLPTGGGRFFLDVAGDSTSSYPGDFLAPGGASTTYSTAAGPATNTLSVVGDVSTAVPVGATVIVGINNVASTRVVSSLSYSNVTNVTTVVLTTTDVPGGQVKQVFILGQEVADTVTTPSHNLRVHLTSTGAYQVVQFYLDLLVRSAGVKVRLAII